MDSDFKVPVTSGDGTESMPTQNFGADNNMNVGNNSIPLSPQVAPQNHQANHHNNQHQAHHQPSTVFSAPEQNTSLNSYNFAQNKEPKGLIVPYLASLIAGTILMVAAFYSLLGLITYVIEHTINQSNNSESSLGYISSFDHIIALSSVALLLVSLPVSMLMFMLVRKYEKRDEWRIKQKTRKMVYVVASVVLILGIIGSLSSMIYSILSTSLDTNSIGAYTSLYGGESSTPKIDKTKAITSSVVEGISALIILLFAVFTLGNEYLSKMRKLLWFVFLGVALIGLSLTAVTLMKVKSAANDSKKNSAKASSLDTKTDFQYDYPPSSSSSSSSSALSTATKTELDFVKSDLNYYKEKNSNYPTLAQWKDGSLKTDYLLSSQSTLDKITYNPSGCDSKGCKSFELTAKDSSGKTVSVKSD